MKSIFNVLMLFIAMQFIGGCSSEEYTAESYYIGDYYLASLNLLLPDGTPINGNFYIPDLSYVDFSLESGNSYKTWWPEILPFCDPSFGEQGIWEYGGWGYVDDPSYDLWGEFLHFDREYSDGIAFVNYDSTETFYDLSLDVATAELFNDDLFFYSLGEYAADELIFNYEGSNLYDDGYYLGKLYGFYSGYLEQYEILRSNSSDPFNVFDGLDEYSVGFVDYFDANMLNNDLNFSNGFSDGYNLEYNTGVSYANDQFVDDWKFYLLNFNLNIK